MAERRTLIEGIKPSTESASTVMTPREKDFIYGRTRREPELPQERGVSTTQARVRLTTRVRGDLGKALKRASLERELSGERPYDIQDILDACLEPWLNEHGYLD